MKVKRRYCYALVKKGGHIHLEMLFYTRKRAAYFRNPFKHTIVKLTINQVRPTRKG